PRNPTGPSRLGPGVPGIGSGARYPPGRRARLPDFGKDRRIFLRGARKELGRQCVNAGFGISRRRTFRIPLHHFPDLVPHGLNALPDTAGPAVRDRERYDTEPAGLRSRPLQVFRGQAQEFLLMSSGRRSLQGSGGDMPILYGVAVGQLPDQVQLQKHRDSLFHLMRFQGRKDFFRDMRRTVLVMVKAEVMPDHAIIPARIESALGFTKYAGAGSLESRKPFMIMDPLFLRFRLVELHQ